MPATGTMMPEFAAATISGNQGGRVYLCLEGGGGTGAASGSITDGCCSGSLYRVGASPPTDCSVGAHQQQTVTPQPASWRTKPGSMRRCGSDPDIAQVSSVSQLVSCSGNSLGQKSPQARWRWAFQMVSFLTKGCCESAGGSVMLLPEHWLEARHPEHRSHLKPYFDIWINSSTRQSFFYWLDKGDGRHIDLPQRPRAEMESRRVRYCGPELALLEVIVEDGLLKYRIGHRIVHTPMEDTPESSPRHAPFGNTATSCQPGESRPKSKWIYVLDLDNRMYINKKQAGEFHHSSFTRGGPVRAAGSIIADHGQVKQITAWSGHYRPTEQDFREVIHYLESRGVDMSKVEKFLTKNKPGSKMRVPREQLDQIEAASPPLDFRLRRLSLPSLQVYNGSPAKTCSGGANGNATRLSSVSERLSVMDSAGEDGPSSMSHAPDGSETQPAGPPHVQHLRATPPTSHAVN